MKWIKIKYFVYIIIGVVGTFEILKTPGTQFFVSMGLGIVIGENLARLFFD